MKRSRFIKAKSMKKHKPRAGRTAPALSHRVYSVRTDIPPSVVSVRPAGLSVRKADSRGNLPVSASLRSALSGQPLAVQRPPTEPSAPTPMECFAFRCIQNAAASAREAYVPHRPSHEGGNVCQVRPSAPA